MTLILGCTMTMVFKQTPWKSPFPNLAPHSSTGCIIPWAVPPPTLDENIISQKALLFLILYNTVQTILCTIQYSTIHSRVSSLQVPGASFADTKIPAPSRGYSTLLYSTALNCTAVHCIARPFIALYNIIVHCTVQHCTKQYVTTLHCKTLHCTDIHRVNCCILL